MNAALICWRQKEFQFSRLDKLILRVEAVNGLGAPSSG